MKKHIFAIFTYFTTFFLSFFLVSFLTEKPQSKATTCFPGRNTAFRKAPVLNTQQIQIRELLRRDRKFGLDYFATDEQASDTRNLVKNMQSLDTSDLPLPIRKAYKTHTTAWNNFALHLKRYGKHDESDKDCINLNRDINETYNILLLAAENYGVEFRR